MCVDEKRGSLLALGWRLGILAGLIKVARGALFFQALSVMFECELKQAFIMWPQPWSPWCWERGPATDSHGLLAGADAFPSSLPPPMIPFSTLLLASNPAFPLSFLSSAILPPQSLYLSLPYSYSSFTTASLSTHFSNHPPWRTAFKLVLGPGSLLSIIFVCGFSLVWM